MRRVRLVNNFHIVRAFPEQGMYSEDACKGQSQWVAARPKLQLCQCRAPCILGGYALLFTHLGCAGRRRWRRGAAEAAGGYEASGWAARRGPGLRRPGAIRPHPGATELVGPPKRILLPAISLLMSLWSLELESMVTHAPLRGNRDMTGLLALFAARGAADRARRGKRRACGAAGGGPRGGSSGGGRGAGCRRGDGGEASALVTCASSHSKNLKQAGSPAPFQSRRRREVA